MINIRFFQLSDYREVMQLVQCEVGVAQQQHVIHTLAQCIALDSTLVLLAMEQANLIGLCFGYVCDQVAYTYQPIVGTAVHVKASVALQTALRTVLEQRRLSSVIACDCSENKTLQYATL
jgi:hypothetical protein